MPYPKRTFVFTASPALTQFEIKLSVSADEDAGFADGGQVLYGTTDTSIPQSCYYQDHVYAGDKSR